MLNKATKHAHGSSLAVTFDVFGLRTGFRNKSPVGEELFWTLSRTFSPLINDFVMFVLRGIAFCVRTTPAVHT